MAIDYIIDYDCIPKQRLTTEGLLERLKGLERAADIIALHREAGDTTPPGELEFEFRRRTGDGHETLMVVKVRHLLDEAADLEPLEHHCTHCPANRAGRPFGCAGSIPYPIPAATETWLLNQLPGSEAPLVYLLLQKGIEDFEYDGQAVAPLRRDGVYFESPRPPARHLGDFLINASQVYEMLFTVGDIIPNHAAMVLLFFHAIDRDLQAHEIMALTPVPPEATRRFPFRLALKPNDAPDLAAMKAFFHALYIAWTLNVRLRVDA
ncbi:MAG: hypothetical protein MUE40_06185 [Anaerolineae bacterium]|jgi:hypothetical protein|nr:hypothetical protein [Anaerolineae bacterium]